MNLYAHTTALQKLHDEKEVAGRLEGGKQPRQERRVAVDGQDALLRQRLLHVVVLDDANLLQNLDGIELSTAAQQHHKH